jgi:hypothetical protein
MARKLHYRIPDDGKNTITDREWDDVLRLQHWYNSEFFWTAGKLAFKMFAVFQNIAKGNLAAEEWQAQVSEKMEQYRKEGLCENEIVRVLEREGLVIAKQGGYAEGCLASGFTRVAANEFNAYLTAEFVLKVSHLLRESTILLEDEGEFIKPKRIIVRCGEVIIPAVEPMQLAVAQNMAEHRHAFAIVDSLKYNQFPKYRSNIPEFGEMTREEQSTILSEWNWLGFESNYDINGDDIQGLNLNEKVSKFSVEPMAR